MKYLSTFEAAEKWGISHRRVSILCNEGRITGAQRAGSRWIIPENAEKPADARIRSGKYLIDEMIPKESTVEKNTADSWVEQAKKLWNWISQKGEDEQQ